ncbi:MAG: CRISPR-associated protein Cas4 [Syntrophomonadaceae bacterium]|nr:CRISPR-associated protein Cas4 [Syntrophomonadaceae bacterium]
MGIEVNGTLIQQYYICKREVWLTSRQLSGDQENENLTMGRIIGEFAYKRDNKELDIGGSKIDLIRTENGNVVIGEIKKSSRFLESASKQLLFYLLQLKEMGIKARGELMIPEEKKKIPVELDSQNERDIIAAIKDIKAIIARDTPPGPERNKYCRNCAYRDFCWA